ncbi:MAG: sodium:solute symporter family protein [Chlamydiales bacterium]|nr:sodium:solute symporter family protein [Chlamydiales bacterium]
MNVKLFFILLAGLGAASLWLGRRASTGQKTNEDYFLMGRKLGLFALIMTLLATQIGGGALMGASEEAYSQGWGVLFYPLGMVLGLFVLGLGYGAKMRRLNLTTIPEIFETIYRSSKLRQIAALLSIASLYFILIGQAIAARKFFLSLGLEGNLLFIGFWLVLILYTVMGGLKAVVSTDIMQTLFILIAFGIAVFASFTREPALPENVIFAPSTSPPWFSWLMLPLLFMLIEQDMGQRCFAAKKPRTITLAAIAAGAALLIVSLVPIYFGREAAAMGIEIPEGASILITAVRALTNPTVATFVICAILMAVISTADSLLCSISSNVACDFPKLRKSVLASQAITAGVGISTLILSFLFDNVVTMLMFSYELAVSVLFVPVTMAIWRKNPSKPSAAAAMALGTIGFLLFRVWTPPLPKELLTLTCAFGGFFASERALQKGKNRSTN